MWRLVRKANDRQPARDVAPHEVHGLALLLAVAAAITAACGSSAEQNVAATEQPALTADSSPTVSTPTPEDPKVPEGPVSGDGEVSVELAGLPIGGGSASAVGDAWCQLLSWNAELPSDVTISIDAVRLQEQGAQLLTGGCASTPSCVGMVIHAESLTCAVLVKPDTPQAPSVTVQLDGTLRCPDEQTCDDLQSTSGGSFNIENPGGGESTDGAATPAGSTGDDGARDGAGATPGPSATSTP
jgi:hypothetical protein